MLTNSDDNQENHSLFRDWNNTPVANINISQVDVISKYRLYFIGFRIIDCNKIQNVSILAPEILSDDNLNSIKLFFFNTQK